MTTGSPPATVAGVAVAELPRDDDAAAVDLPGAAEVVAGRVEGDHPAVQPGRGRVHRSDAT